MSSTELIVEPAAAPVAESPASTEQPPLVSWPWEQAAIGLLVLIVWKTVMAFSRDWIADWPPLAHVVVGAIIPQLWMIFWPLGAARLAGDVTPFRVPGWPTLLREGSLGLVFGFATMGLLYGMSLLYRWLTGDALGTAVEAAATGTSEVVILACLAFTVTPFAEELFFRGMVYGALRERLGVGWGLIFQAAIFALMHDLEPLKLVVIFVLGLVLGGVYQWRRTLASSIAIHFVLNLLWSLAVFAMLLIFAHAPYLGVQGRAAEQGVVIEQVLASSPAEQAGLLRGDTILSLGGEAITSQEQVARLVRSRQPGDRLAIELLRGGERKTIEAVLAKRPRE
jgi:membrane protease YdiL (CAAX protease family)